MKRIVALLCLVIGCRSVPVSTTAAVGSNATPATATGVGATSPQAAVEQFLAGANAQDVQAMSAVWGAEGGLSRDHMPRSEVETRMFISACVLKSDTHTLGQPTIAENNRMFVIADLTQGKNSGSIQFTVARTRDNRWLVEDYNISGLQNKGFCKR